MFKLKVKNKLIVIFLGLLSNSIAFSGTGNPNFKDFTRTEKLVGVPTLPYDSTAPSAGLGNRIGTFTLSRPNNGVTEGYVRAPFCMMSGIETDDNRQTSRVDIVSVDSHSKVWRVVKAANIFTTKVTCFFNGPAGTFESSTFDNTNNRSSEFVAGITVRTKNPSPNDPNNSADVSKRMRSVKLDSNTGVLVNEGEYTTAAVDVCSVSDPESYGQPAFDAWYQYCYTYVDYGGSGNN